MGHAQNGKQFFFADITKADHQVSETFYFIKISNILTELWIFFYLSDAFCQKSVISTPAKTAVTVTVMKLYHHGCTNRSNLEMELKYLMKSDIQLNPNILRTKNDKRVL